MDGACGGASTRHVRGAGSDLASGGGGGVSTIATGRRVLIRANALIIISSLLFVAFAIALTAAVALFSGRPDSRASRRVQAFKPLRGLLEFMARADPSLARSVVLLRAATVQQLAIIACDALTMWTLLRSIGAPAQMEAVFASFMIASLVRTLGVVPGGLGTFEATHSSR